MSLAAICKKLRKNEKFQQDMKKKRERKASLKANGYLNEAPNELK